MHQIHMLKLGPGLGPPTLEPGPGPVAPWALGMHHDGGKSVHVEFIAASWVSLPARINKSVHANISGWMWTLLMG